MNQDDLANRFTFHPAHGDQPDRYQHIRASCFKLAELFDALCPDSRELSLAITNLEQANLWANAAIARNEEHYDGPAHTQSRDAGALPKED